MTARHHGQVQPEYRLPAMLMPAVIGPMGMLTFGLVVASQKSWGGAAVGFGMEGFGATAAANIIITYAVDAYRPVRLPLLIQDPIISKAASLKRLTEMSNRFLERQLLLSSSSET